MPSEEISTGHTSVQWVNDLREIIDEINEKREEINKKREEREKKKNKKETIEERTLRECNCYGYGDACIYYLRIRK